MSDLGTLPFFLTPQHDCSYINRSDAQTLFLDPKFPLNATMHSHLSTKGFRRSGSYLYRPHCQNCDACIPLRIPVTQFSYPRRFKRILKKNSMLSFTWRPAICTDEHYQLYERYITERHYQGDMYPPSREQFTSFLLNDWSKTQFLEIRLEEKLIAVAVTDPLSDGLSAVYTFFDPDQATRSLGVLAVLKQVEQCQTLNLSHLYLGYWVKACQKMSYKSQFRPVEAYLNNRWERLPPA